MRDLTLRSSCSPASTPCAADPGFQALLRRIGPESVSRRFKDFSGYALRFYQLTPTRIGAELCRAEYFPSKSVNVIPPTCWNVDARI